MFTFGITLGTFSLNLLSVTYSSAPSTLISGLIDIFVLNRFVEMNFLIFYCDTSRCDLALADAEIGDGDFFTVETDIRPFSGDGSSVIRMAALSFVMLESRTANLGSKSSEKFLLVLTICCLDRSIFFCLCSLREGRILEIDRFFATTFCFLSNLSLLHVISSLSLDSDAFISIFSGRY